MLYAVATLALALLSGSQAQEPCTGEAIQITYENCGRIGPMNVYWTVNAAANQTNILFEAPDDAWTAFGFTAANTSVGAMNEANVIFGCSDFPGLAEGPYDAVLPVLGEGRTVATVAAGFNASNLAVTGGITTMRVDGICANRFVRNNVLADDILGQNLVSGSESGVVWARGTIGAQDTAGQHASRGFATQDFIGEAGDITDSPVVSLIEVADENDDDDNSGSLASVSTLLSGVVTALALALW